MNFFAYTYINLVVFGQAPKTYFRYLQYCVINNKSPDYRMLAKIMRVSQTIKALNEARKLKPSSQNKVELKLDLINLL